MVDTAVKRMNEQECAAYIIGVDRAQNNDPLEDAELLSFMNTAEAAAYKRGYENSAGEVQIG